MLSNNFKIAFRNARKNRVLSFAKLFGISVSFAVVLFATGYVYYETSFDKCVPDYNKIFRCTMQGKLDGKEADFAVTSSLMAEAVLNEIPEITNATCLRFRGQATIYHENKVIEAGPLLFADNQFFNFFGINIQTTIQNPFDSENNITISKSLALQHFGSVENALGEIVLLHGDKCSIIGVFNDFPANFHLQAKVIQSIHKVNPELDGWSQIYSTYIKTNVTNIDINALNFKLTKTVYSHSNDEYINGNLAKNWEDLKYNDNTYIFYNAEPLADIHFSKHKFNNAVTSDKRYVYGAVILALLVLLISSINFINLTIANLSTRLREIGIRKITGAFNKQIVFQFLYESFIFGSIGFSLAVILYQIAAKPLRQYLGFEIVLSNTELFKIILFLFIGLLGFNMVANIIPITVMSNRKVLWFVKEKNQTKNRFSVKDSFVILQFALSGLIILCSFIVQKQINHVVNKERGYDSENVLMLSMWDMHPNARKSFIEDLKSHTTIESVSTSDVYFGEDFGMSSGYFESKAEENFFHTSVLPVDDEFVNTFNLEMKEGRFFDKERQTDFESVILNETALKEYSGQGSLIGKNILLSDKPFKVIGIVKDFNFRSLHHRIQPLVIKRINNFGNVTIKFRNNQTSEVLGILKEHWAKHKVPFPLNYTFHDEVLAMQYTKDQQAKKLLFLLSVISIVIACFGLYAISLFTILRKTKEIGIRKVNGAKVSEVLAMLNKDFVKWVAIAFVIACPIAYYAMNKWLENFAYKTTLSWWIFALAGVIALGIALLTVSWQSWRAATQNPVEALRYE